MKGFNIPNDQPGSGGRPGRLAAYAYCVRASAALVTASKRLRLPAQPGDGSNRVRTFRVRCPRGGRAVSGGFDGHITVSGEPTAAGALTSMRTADGRGWRTTGLSLSERAPARLTAYVYCRSR